MPDPMRPATWPSALGPRSLRRRQMIAVELTPAEINTLIASIEAEAASAAGAGRDMLADPAYARAAVLREMAR